MRDPHRASNYVLLVALACTFAPRVAADDAKAAFQNVQRAAVEVLVDDRLAGSGCFVSRDGLIVTAAHVLGRPDRRVEVRTTHAGRLDASVVAVDLGHDLALLRVEPRDDGHPFVTPGDDTLALRQRVWLYGAPMFRHDILLHGRVARPTVGFEWLPNEKRYVGCYFVSGPSPSGTSGGAWFNDAGQLVGVQSGMMTANNSSVGVSFVAPVAAVRRLIDSGRSTRTPTVGGAFEEVWEQSHDYLKRLPPRTEGLVARVLIEDGPLAKAGVQQWQVVTAIDGQTVRLRDELLAAVRAKKPGDAVELTILNPDDGGSTTVKVTLDALETTWQPTEKE